MELTPQSSPAPPMLIAAFAERTGLSRDTIRFYVQKGLLRPTVGAAGTNRYQTFTADDVERALLIRHAQQLGFTLREIAGFDAKFGDGGMSLEEQGAVMSARLTSVNAQLANLRKLQKYFRAKIAWLESGGLGEEPVLA